DPERQRDRARVGPAAIGGQLVPEPLALRLRSVRDRGAQVERALPGSRDRLRTAGPRLELGGLRESRGGEVEDAPAGDRRRAAKLAGVDVLDAVRRGVVEAIGPVSELEGRHAE